MRKLIFVLFTVILIVGIFFAQSYRINPLLNKKLDYYSANTDVLVAIDSAATAGYLGAASSDGVLRTGVSLSYTDGGDFVTINAIQDIRTSAGPTFESLQLNDDTTVAYDLILDSDSDGTAFTADRTLTFDLNNANRVIDLSGDLTLSASNKVADWEVTGDLQNSGASLTIQKTGGQDVSMFSSTTGNEVFYGHGNQTGVGVKYWKMWVDTSGNFNIDLNGSFGKIWRNGAQLLEWSNNLLRMRDNNYIAWGSGDDYYTKFNSTTNIVESIVGGTCIGISPEYGTGIIVKTVNWDDSSPVAVCTVADGYCVIDVWVEITTAWDGNGTIEIGDGGDPNGFLDDGNITQATPGYYGNNEHSRGAYLNNSLQKIYTGADTVDATLVQGTSTQGVAVVYVNIARLK